ncbi:MAG: hypothetical protein E3K32_10225 [wastewater metagenome]|nr:hypothetical protein [Candidatus Loosdrechtia aerotolerans]
MNNFSVLPFPGKYPGCIIILLLCTILSMSCNSFSSSNFAAGNKITWNLIGPGDADQVTSLSVDADGIVYAGTDVGGIYSSNNQGEYWIPLNNGIKNYDITTPVVIDPADEATLFVGTRGGFYKSTDRGATWRSVWKGIGTPQEEFLSASIGSIALNHEKTHILYLGLGYRPSTEGGGVIKKISWSGNIYMSRESGGNWELISSLPQGSKIRHIAVDSKNTNTVYAATNAGLFKSMDAGKTWKKIMDTAVKYIAIHPDDSRCVFIAAGSNGVFKSHDEGNSWEKKNQGLGFIKTKSKHFDNYATILIDTKNTKTVYAINSTWGDTGGVYKSINNGETWIMITRWGSASGTKGNVEQAWLNLSRKVNAIALDPNNTERIYIGTSRYLYRSDDGGSTWKQLISREVSPGRWTHKGINVFGQTLVVGIDPKDHNYLYAGTADHGLVISDDNGKSWFPSEKGMKYKDDILDIAVDPKQPNIVHVINSKRLRVCGFATSFDYGKTWNQRTKGLPDDTRFYTILVNPYDTESIFLGGKKGVYRSGDRGNSWVEKNKGLPGGTIVNKLLCHPGKNGILYAATNNGLYRSNNNGESWDKTHKTSLSIASLAIDPHQPNHVYAGVIRSKMGPGGVYKSINAGKTWTQVLSGSKRIEAVAVIPSYPPVIYALSNDHQYHDESAGEGVFRSIDGGKTWESVNNGLAVLRGFNINVNPSPPYELYLSANGSGVYVAIDPVMESIHSKNTKNQTKNSK